jgi:hypothetical protein
MKVISGLEDFLSDFQYFKLQGYDAFYQLFESGSKLIVINSTPYRDGIMLEIQLAVKVDDIEECLFRFYKQEYDKLSLSFWESLTQIYSDVPKRSLIENPIELSKWISEIETALVKKGFNWLDGLSDLKSISNYLSKKVFDKVQKPTNIFKLSQRSYLIRTLLGEKMTEAIFYEYYEQMQLHKVPEHQLGEFLEFKKFLQTDFI